MRRALERDLQADDVAALRRRHVSALGRRAAAGPPAKLPSYDKFRRALEADRPQVVNDTADSALIAAAGACASLDDTELARYLDLLRSPARHRYDMACLRAYGTALVDAAAEFGRLAGATRPRGKP